MGAGHSNPIHEDEPALASLQDIDIFSDEHISEQHGGKKVFTTCIARSCIHIQN